MVVNALRRHREAGAEMKMDTVSICIVRPLVQALREKSVDPAPLLAQAGLTDIRLDDDNARVSPSGFAQFYRFAVIELNDEACSGLERPLALGTYAFLAEIMADSANLEQAFRRAVRLFKVLDRDISMTLKRNEVQTRLAVHYDTKNDPIRRFFLEAFTATLHRMASWMLGEYLPLDRVEMAGESPSHSEEHVRMFSAPISYGHAQHSLIFRTVYLDQAVTRTRAEVAALVKAGPLELMRRSPVEGSYSVRVRKLIQQQLPNHPSQVDIARHLGLAEQTLRRRLHQEGHTFRSVKEELLKELATGYLSHQDRSLTEIATLLGYSEPSAFNRAFKGWTGLTPGHYRDQHWQQATAAFSRPLTEDHGAAVSA